VTLRSWIVCDPALAKAGPLPLFRNAESLTTTGPMTVIAVLPAVAVTRRIVPAAVATAVMPLAVAVKLESSMRRVEPLTEPDDPTFGGAKLSSTWTRLKVTGFAPAFICVQTNAVAPQRSKVSVMVREPPLKLNEYPAPSMTASSIATDALALSVPPLAFEFSTRTWLRCTPAAVSERIELPRPP
jgi:hypothetical protein